MDEHTYLDALQALSDSGHIRRMRNVELLNGTRCLVEGEPAVNFSSNDYLGLSHDERLKHAAIEAIKRYGTGVGSSRLIAGTNRLVMQLEAELAAFKGTQAALVFNSGYQANVAILQAVLEPGDYVFCDRLNHASLMDGVLLSGARWTRYRHLDYGHLEDKLKKAPPEARKWIVTDSVFSMDGDYPDLRLLTELAERYNAFTLVDEAHATGLFGEKSSGLCEQFGVSDRVTLQMGTFSKAMGGAGAFVACSWIMRDVLVNRARGFIFSTGLPPAAVGSALKALEIIRTDPRPRNRLWENLRRFLTHCDEKNVPVPAAGQTPIVPVVIGDIARTVSLSNVLLEQGFYVQSIRPPTVPPGTARLRITVTAAHQPDQLVGLANRLEVLGKASSAPGS